MAPVLCELSERYWRASLAIPGKPCYIGRFRLTDPVVTRRVAVHGWLYTGARGAGYRRARRPLSPFDQKPFCRQDRFSE
jgi:hypothetical protein